MARPQPDWRTGNGARLATPCGRLRIRRLPRSSRRNFEHDRSPLFGRGLDPDLSPVAVDDASRDVKPETDAPPSAVPSLPVAIEDMEGVGLGNSWTRVCDLESRSRARLQNANVDRAVRRRELHGVADEIRKHLDDALPIN